MFHTVLAARNNLPKIKWLKEMMGLATPKLFFFLRRTYEMGILALMLMLELEPALRSFVLQKSSSLRSRKGRRGIDLCVTKGVLQNLPIEVGAEYM